MENGRLERRGTAGGVWSGVTTGISRQRNEARAALGEFAMSADVKRSPAADRAESRRELVNRFLSASLVGCTLGSFRPRPRCLELGFEESLLKRPTGDDRPSRSTLSLFVDCAWRVDSGGKTLCGSGDRGTVNVSGLLKGIEVVSVSILSVEMDTLISLAGSIQMLLFPTTGRISLADNEFTDWRLYRDGQLTLSVGPGSHSHMRG
jgi:hypothetical protein